MSAILQVSENHFVKGWFGAPLLAFKHTKPTQYKVLTIMEHGFCRVQGDVGTSCERDSTYLVWVTFNVLIQMHLDRVLDARTSIG